MTYVQTTIDFDLSKIQNLPKEKGKEKIKASLLREVSKLSIEPTAMRFFSISSPDLSDKDLLPQSIRFYIFSSRALNCFAINESKSAEAYAHTLIPIHYHSKMCEGDLEDGLDQFTTKSEYVFNILYEMNVWNALRDYSKASSILAYTTQNLSVDDKIQTLLQAQSLRDRIESKYHFFHEAIQAYDDHSLQSLLPETWSVKSIMRIIRSDCCDELSLFSLVCLKIQHERSHGKTVPNILINVPQEEPLHIGLFDTYQVYLDAMENIIDGISEVSELAVQDKKKCLNLFQKVESKLNIFMLNHLSVGAEINSLRQNAWINLLQKVKSLFHWVAMLHMSQKERMQRLIEIPWIPFSAEESSKGFYFQKHPMRRVSIEYYQSMAMILSIIENHQEGFEIENYLRVLEQEVSEGIYTFAEDAMTPKTFHTLQKILEPREGQSAGRFVSGLGCHLEISEPLTERDLILLSYTSLTPVGHFMPLYSFHDGHWRSSCWLRAHDPYHQGLYVRTFERMGVDISDLSIHRYRNIDRMTNYLDVIHKMLQLLDKADQGLTQVERDYIRLNLFMSHETILKSQTEDILDSEDSIPLLPMKKTIVAILQDLLFSMGIRIEERLSNGKVLVILPGAHELNSLSSKAHFKYKEIKRDALVEHINEKLLMPMQSE